MEQTPYNDHLAYWQEVIHQLDLSARWVRKNLTKRLGVKISNNNQIRMVQSDIAALSRCAIEVQDALKWYESQIVSGDATSPLTAVEKNRHAKFLKKSEELWKSILSECNDFDKKLEPIKKQIDFLNWKFANHPLTHRETGNQNKGGNQ